jgi:TonB family protein
MFIFAQESLASYRYLNEGYRILKKTLGADDKKTGLAAYYIAKYYYAAHQFRNARRKLLEALDAFDDPDKPDHKMELTIRGLLVDVYERMGNRDEATQHCLAIGRMTPVSNVQDYFPVFKLPPAYPSIALNKKIEGYSIVEFDVNESGFVVNPRIIETSHSEFEENSLEAAKKFRYAPAFVDGKPVKTAGVRNQFTYRLK